MPYKSKEKRADYMREYRRKQKEIAEDMKRRLKEYEKKIRKLEKKA